MSSQPGVRDAVVGAVRWEQKGPREGGRRGSVNDRRGGSKSQGRVLFATPAFNAGATRVQQRHVYVRGRGIGRQPPEGVVGAAPRSGGVRGVGVCWEDRAASRGCSCLSTPANTRRQVGKEVEAACSPENSPGQRPGRQPSCSRVPALLSCVGGTPQALPEVRTQNQYSCVSKNCEKIVSLSHSGTQLKSEDK